MLGVVAVMNLFESLWEWVEDLVFNYFPRRIFKGWRHKIYLKKINARWPLVPKQSENDFEIRFGEGWIFKNIYIRALFLDRERVGKGRGLERFKLQRFVRKGFNQRWYKEWEQNCCPRPTEKEIRKAKRILSNCGYELE